MEHEPRPSPATLLSLPKTQQGHRHGLGAEPLQTGGHVPTSARFHGHTTRGSVTAAAVLVPRLRDSLGQRGPPGSPGGSLEPRVKVKLSSLFPAYATRAETAASLGPQHGRGLAPEVHGAGRARVRDCNSRGFRKAICGTKAGLNRIVSHQVAEKEVQRCQECGDTVDIIQAEGDNFQTSCPTSGLSTCIHPHSPVSTLLSCLQEASTAPVFCPRGGQSHLTSRFG